MRGTCLASVWKLALLVALCSSVSCGTPTFVVQQYDGPVRSADTIAIIRVDGGGKVQLLSLDGEATDARVTPDARLHIEVLPGNHSLWVQNLVDNGPAHSLVFRAEAGKVYRVQFIGLAAGSAASPHVYEVDRSSNALRVDVTAAQAPPLEAPPPGPVRAAPPPARIIVEEPRPSSLPADAGAPEGVNEPTDAGTRAP